MKPTTKDDPLCCQYDNCTWEVVKGQTHCAKHGGCVELKNAEKSKVRTYTLTKFRAQMTHFLDDDNIKGLREEIGILRIVLQERLNMCESSVDLLSHAHTIGDLAMKIEKLVSSCNKIEKSLGQYLDQNAIVQLGMEVVAIVTKHVDDTKAIENIADDLIKVIERIGKDEPS